MAWTFFHLGGGDWCVLLLIKNINLVRNETVYSYMYFPSYFVVYITDILPTHVQCFQIDCYNHLCYSLRPKKQVTLGFEICPKKQVILLYLESACACKNQFYLLVNLSYKS